MADAALLHGTCSAALGRAKLAFAVARGFEEDVILRILRTTRAELDDPDGRLPMGPALAFWEHVVRTLDDPGVPIQFAERMSPSDFGVLGFAAMTAPSGRDALHRAARYYELLVDMSRLTLEDTDEGVRIELLRAGERVLAVRLVTEYAVACLLQSMRAVTGVGFAPVRVAFRHPAPRDVDAHRRFFRAPIQFEVDWDGMVVPSSVLARVPPATNIQMGSFFERHAQELLRRVQSDRSLPERVRASIAQELANGEPSMAAVAKRLGTSERTLRRLLESESASFRDLVDAVRRDLALEYLRDAKANVTEIAYLLGFSEVSAFSRAFKRWYGDSPRTYRRS